MAYNTQIQENQLSVETVTLECPKCHWMFRVKKPNGKPNDYSFVKPKDTLNKIIISVEHVCRNPKCKHSFNLFSWELE